MKQSPTISEFESMLTTRALSTRMTNNGVIVEEVEYTDMLDIMKFACIDLLRGLNMHKNIRVVRRGERLFLVNEFTRKIVAEVGLDFEPAKGGKIRRPKALIISRYRLPKYIQDLSQERKNYGYNNKISKR